MGRTTFVFCAMLIALVGRSAATLPQVGQIFAAEARVADLKSFVDLFKDNYAFIDRAEKPWNTWLQRYEGPVRRSETREAYAGVLSGAVDELHDFHAEVRARNPHRWLPVPTFADIWATFDHGKVLVSAVRKGSDAERNEVKPGFQVLDVNGVPAAQAIAERLASSLNPNSPDARQWAVLSVLCGRSDQERSLTLRTPKGETVRAVLQQERHFDRPSGLLNSRTLVGNIGYIRFNNMLGEQATVAAFDKALVELRHTKGLILDLRDVPSGGNSSVALGILGRLVTKMLPYQRHRIPHYGQVDSERNWFEMVAPRGPFAYRAPIAVLVDHWTGSMGEGMASGIDGMHRGIVIGTPMAHLAGAISDFTLPQTGIDVAFATGQVYHVGGTPRHQWLPPVLVKEQDYRGRDAILETALKLLRKKSDHN